MSSPLEIIEYGKRTFDSSAFVRDGRVELNSEAQSKANITFAWFEGGMRVQAGGMIGLVPLNADVVLQVTPRVPIARLEELIRRSESAPFINLTAVRGFNPAQTDFLSLDDLMAARFSAILHELPFEGLYKTYVRETSRGTMPFGRILPAPTYISLHTSHRPQAQFESFVRTIDNGINRLILAAGKALVATLAVATAKGSRKLARSIESQLRMFDGVTTLTTSSQKSGHGQSEPVPANRPILNQVVELARLILLQRGVRFFGQGNVTLPSFLINMETVFENYVRRVLKASPVLNAFNVLDGNLQPPTGAASQIFEIAGPLGNHETAPDIVIKDDQHVLCVADVKYKPCHKKPDRANLEQVLVYALSYGAPCAVLIFPCSEGQRAALQFLGSVKGISCYKATFQLMNADLDAEESNFCDHLAELLRTI